MILGITGSISTGKSTVSGMFKKLGACVIDADRIVHRFLGRTARKALSAFVFDDGKTLKKLCSIIHPMVRLEIIRQIKKNKNKKVIVLDVPLLFESGTEKLCDYTIVVKAAFSRQLERAGKNLSLSPSQLKKRIRFQMPLKEKISLADFVIDNSGLLEDTAKQVRELWDRFRKSKKAGKLVSLLVS